jgi:hypothetical protein
MYFGLEVICLFVCLFVHLLVPMGTRGSFPGGKAAGA